MPPRPVHPDLVWIEPISMGRTKKLIPKPKMKRSLLLSFLCTCAIHSQQRIELTYAAENGTITIQGEAPKVKVPMEYALVLTGINSAHVGAIGRLQAREFVSDIPELLRPLFPGIRDNSVFESIEMEPEKERSPFLHAVGTFGKLERIGELGDALYAETRFAPDTARARARCDQLLEELQSSSLERLKLEVEQAQYYIEALIQSYSVQIETVGISDSLQHKLVQEYSVLRRIKDRLERRDHLEILGFMERSLYATDSIFIGRFRAEGDVVDLELELTDTYTGEFLYEGTLSFMAHGNFSFDFSTGFFYTDLVDHRYYQMPESGIDRLHLEEQGEVDLSIGALAHFSYKLSPGFAAGIAVGTSLSPLDGNLRYLLGPSMTLGHQKQFSLSFGCALSRLDRLSDGVARDAQGHFLPSGQPIPMVKKTVTGLFVGATYNLNRKRP